MKLLIFGASGSGTTTLGKELARHFGWKCLDADRYYWADTDPPFQRKIPLEERNSQIRKDFMASDAVIISGSMVSWGAQWEKAFDLAVFLYIPPAIRMERLRKREVERYGELLQTDETTPLLEVFCKDTPNQKTKSKYFVLAKHPPQFTREDVASVPIPKVERS